MSAIEHRKAIAGNRPIGRPRHPLVAPRIPTGSGKAIRRVPYREADWILAVNMGEQIQKIREEQSVTQDELGAAVGVSRFMVSKWERGACLCPTRRLYQIAQALGVRMADLIPEPY